LNIENFISVTLFVVKTNKKTLGTEQLWTQPLDDWKLIQDEPKTAISPENPTILAFCTPKQSVSAFNLPKEIGSAMTGSGQYSDSLRLRIALHFRGLTWRDDQTIRVGFGQVWCAQVQTVSLQRRRESPVHFLSNIWQARFAMPEEPP